MTRSATVSGGRGVTTGNGELVATWIGAVIWTVLSVPLVWAMTRDAELRSSPWAAFLWLFVALGVPIWASAIRLTFGRLRFGRLTLEPDPVPGSLGGHVGGSVRVPLRHRVAADYRVTLSCVRSRRIPSRNGSSRSEAVVWSAECVPVVEREGRSVRLRFTFDVPQHLPASEETSEDYHYWGVRVRGSVPGVDLDQAFRVQVERSDPPRLAARPAPRQEPSVHLERSGSAGVRVDRRPGHAIVEYRVGREWGTALGVTAFGVFFLAVPLGLLGTILGLGASGEGPDLLPILFAAPFVTVFGLVGLLLVVLGLYLLLNGLTVRLSASEVEAVRRLLFLRRTHREPVDRVEGVEMKIQGQVGSGAKARVSYKLVARLKGGGRLPLGDGIRGPALASELARVVTETTGLPVKEVRRKRLKDRGP